ncbi:MAG: hypothetical protein M4D80_23055 [Myxococcota bacterium]|nr:hypothetical protein [Myxococcota bacterium]
MGFWSRLFGERESAEQKIARARHHLDEREPRLSLKIVERLDGPEADEIRRHARALAETLERQLQGVVPRSSEPDADDPLRDHEDGPYRAPGKPKQQKQPKQPTRPGPGALSIHLGADGSTIIGTGDGGAVTLNAAISDDDGRPRSTDAIDVARRVLASTAEQPIDPRALAFVEAVVVLARAGEPLPRIGNAQRRAVAELAVAATAGDAARVASLIEGGAPEVTEELAWFATPLAVGFAAHELGALALRGLVTPTWMLIEALVKTEPETCAQIVERSASPLFGGNAWLLADAAGVELPNVAWIDWRTADDQQDEWRALEIRRLARRDLEAALVLAAEHADICGPDYAASLELVQALAKTDPKRALAAARDVEPHVDRAGLLAGLAQSRVEGAAEIVDGWIAALGRGTYDPYSYFSELLSASIALGDVERVKRCIAAAGPTGWQIACAAHAALAAAAARGDAHPLLEACYERVPAGVVASRGISRGMLPLAAGKVVMQPGWLDFADPHPIETLALVTALGAETPRWS